jgi:Zn-dependent protease with chaperone function
MHRRINIISALAIAILVSASVATAQTNIKPGFNLFSPQDDVQIGAQSAAEAEQQLPIVRDQAVESYVNRIGQRLAANAGGPGFHYQFKVVNQSDINAFALPGGFVYVNRGVLDSARNEGEVAGVLAHEISHVALRHGTHQASKAYLAQAGISILGGLLGGHVGAGAADIINAVGGLGLNALFLKYSRDLESQADVRGAQILAASGYSPADMVSFFQTLEKVDKSRKTSWLSDHPAPPDRINRIEQEARLLHVTSSPTENVAELRNVQSRLGGTAAARSVPIGQASASTSAPSGRRRSASTGSVTVAAPAATYASYTSPSGVYRIAVPSNWQVMSQTQTGATIAPPGGVVGSDIVYGLIVNHYDPFGNQGYGNISIENATNDLIAQIRQSSPYLQISGSGQRINAGGGTALAATLRGTDPQTGVNERITVITRQLADEHLVYLLFITPERDASNYSRVLNQIVGSLQVNTQQRH